MAVKEMKKLSIICEKEAQERILRVLQGTQQVEIDDIYADSANEDWLKEYFADSQQNEDSGSTEALIRQIQELVRFIRDHGSAKEKVTELKRGVTSFGDFEKTFDEAKLKKELATITQLKERWDQNWAATKQAQAQEDWGTTWQNLDIDIEDSRDKNVTALIGILPNDQWEAFQDQLKQTTQIYSEYISNDQKETAFALLYLRKETPNVLELMQDFGARSETKPYPGQPKEILQQAKADLSQLAQERKELAQLIGDKKAQVYHLQQAEEVLLAQNQRELAQAGIVESQYLAVIRGWIGADEVPILKRVLAKAFPNEQVYLSLDDPTAEEIAANKTPTKLKNNPVVQPFEMLTEMYSIPKYDEIDPTPWMMPFYLVFFGMMVADFGYGLLMLVATTVGLKALTLPKGTQRFLKLFQYLSVSTIVWGLIYGSSFGVEMPVYLLSPSKDFMAIFGLSMVFGGIQIFTGLFLAGKENMRKKDYVAAVNQGFSWQGILAGILIAALGAMVVKSQALTMIGAILAIISALAVLLTSVLGAKSKVGGFFMGLYDLYGITSYIGDFVSYSRLMALGISGGSIAAAFNMLVGYMPPAARFTAGIVLIVVLQGLNIFLSLLSAYVHAARLQYVEFFGKFYTGGGRAFRPLKPAEKYMNFIDENGGNDND
ncbi:V-type ATP synthase subunit I [Enterococcus asini]|uniref:V-type ATP synthase subunit I n=1 Tax=Enterococcus asini TaxID=57732 RepID=UPI00288E52F4|nr:V-type ATP synthase subunit I [Enterococcus asini]MDT2763163.1 V-type ATP synthase subunit I [Enterococcus asini]